MKLSFIIPVYKVESYLRKCVDSLLMQDYDDYEIILVDDGSPDGCPQICDEYAMRGAQCMNELTNEGVSELVSEESSTLHTPQSTERSVPQSTLHTPQSTERSVSQSIPDRRIPIRVIHQKNAGLSAARNSGIAIAQGEYVCFVDSDDFLEPNVLGTLMAQIERDNLDVLRFKYQHVNEQYELFRPYKADPYRDDDYSEIVTDGVCFLNERLGTGCYAWAYILRRDLIYNDQSSNIEHHTLTSNTLFTPGIYFEDTDWTPRMLVRAKRVASTDRIVYNYLVRRGSITQAVSREKQKKVLDDKMRLITALQAQALALREQGCNDAWFHRMISATVVSVIGILSGGFYAERYEYVDKLKRMEIFPIYGLSLKVALINISPLLAVKLIHWKNKRK